MWEKIKNAFLKRMKCGWRWARGRRSFGEVSGKLRFAPTGAENKPLQGGAGQSPAVLKGKALPYSFFSVSIIFCITCAVKPQMVCPLYS